MQILVGFTSVEVVPSQFPAVRCAGGLISEHMWRVLYRLVGLEGKAATGGGNTVMWLTYRAWFGYSGSLAVSFTRCFPGCIEGMLQDKISVEVVPSPKFHRKGPLLWKYYQSARKAVHRRYPASP